MNIVTIIVNWNGKDDTIACLNSLMRAEVPLSSVVLVDNGSTDGSIRAIRDLFPEVHIIGNKDNLGYAGGNNVGIRHALEHGADAVFLLNNDATVEHGVLKAIDDTFGRDTAIGIAGSKIYFHDHPHLVWFSSPRLNAFTGRTYDPEYGTPGLLNDEVRDVPFISGCAFAIRREVIDRIGLLDERFFCYAEELDWCLRAKAAGFRLVVVPASKVYHKVSSSTGGAASGFTMYYRVRNHLLFLKKNLPLGCRALSMIREGFVIILHSAAILKLGMKRREAFFQLARGVKDYYAGNFGKLRCT